VVVVAVALALLGAAGAQADPGNGRARGHDGAGGPPPWAPAHGRSGSSSGSPPRSTAPAQRSRVAQGAASTQPTGYAARTVGNNGNGNGPPAHAPAHGVRRQAASTRQPRAGAAAPRPAGRATPPRRTSPTAPRRPARAVARPSLPPAPAARLPVAAPAHTPAAPAPPRVTRTSSQPQSVRPVEEAHQPLAQTVTREVTRVVGVIPRPVLIAIGVLGLLAALNGAALGVMALRSRRLERQRSRLAEDVGLLQSALLPPLDEPLGAVAVTAAYRPAEGLAAGGDFYDAFALDEHRTGLLIGDVAGHGREAVPLTALVRYSVRAYLEAGLAPRLALQLAGRVLDPQLKGTLVTVLAAVYDSRTGQLTAASAGHHPPLLTGGGEPLSIAASSPPFGLGIPTGRRQVTVALEPGQAACLLTDGLADVRTPSGARLGVKRLAEEIGALGGELTAQRLLDRVARLGADRPDDMAAVVLRPADGGATPAPVRVDELEADASDVRRDRAERFLRACGAGEREVEEALDTARSIAPRSTAVLEVRRDSAGTSVTVRRAPVLTALGARTAALSSPSRAALRSR
jgi:hypothetical protein